MPRTEARRCGTRGRGLVVLSFGSGMAILAMTSQAGGAYIVLQCMCPHCRGATLRHRTYGIRFIDKIQRDLGKVSHA